jgi:NAD(P)-dependent dehydrogenase (short-subunit alcohol dehydrogenase family)
LFRKFHAAGAMKLPSEPRQLTMAGYIRTAMSSFLDDEYLESSDYSSRHFPSTTIMASVFRPGATALITGSASGVGFAFARLCRQQGLHLALVDRDSKNLNTAVELLRSESKHPDLKTEGYTLDVSDLSAWKSVASDVHSTFGDAIDLLMLNAGHGPKPNGSSWLDVDYWHRTLDTNLYGVVNGIATFLPAVQKSKGPSAIVITGSKQGITNPPGTVF